MGIIHALVSIAGKESVPLLLERMKTEKRPNNTSQSDDELYDELYSDSVSVRETIAQELGGLGSDAADAVPLFATILADENEAWSVHQAVTVSLGKIGPAAARAVPQLLHILNHDDPDLGESAVKSLGQIGPAAKRAVPRLSTMLNAKETPESMKKLIKTALRQIDPDVLPNKDK